MTESPISIAPWEREGSAISFTDDATGLPCKMLRHKNFGTWCAYIGVPDYHPWHGLSYSAPVNAPEALVNRPVSMDELGAINILCAGVSANPEQGIWPIDVLVRCHGGITFSDKPYWDREDRATWWFGFDCAHGGDYIPAHAAKYNLADGIYRDASYVRDYCVKAAADIAMAAKKGTKGVAA